MPAHKRPEPTAAAEKVAAERELNLDKVRKRNRTPKTQKPEQLCENAIAHARVADVDTYTAGTIGTVPRRSDGGRPQGWPPAFQSAARNLFGTDATLSTRRWRRILATDPFLLPAVWDGVEAHYADDPVMLEWARSARNRNPCPSRSTIQRWITDPGWDGRGALLDSAVKTAVALGLFDASQHSALLAPARVVVGDGKAFKSPTRNPQETVDPETGEILARRHDPNSHIYTQGGGEQVYGPKFAYLLAPTPDECSVEMVVGIIPLDDPSPKHEAMMIVEYLIEFDGRLQEATNGTHTISALVMDGAPDSEVNQLLAAAGIGLLAPPPRTAGEKERTHTTGAFTVTNGARVRFQWQGNKVFELVNVDGTLSPKQCNVAFKKVRTRGKPHLYVEVKTMAGEVVRIPCARMTGGSQPMETVAAHHQRMSLMRAASTGDDVWEKTQEPLRGAVEGFNKRVADPLPHGRMPAYGRSNQMIKLILHALNNNAYVTEQYRRAHPEAVPRPDAA
ncbi:MAG: hypothetical protein ACOYEV_10420 [Candidatus Nanopelagicales bacterium]